VSPRLPSRTVPRLLLYGADGAYHAEDWDGAEFGALARRLLREGGAAAELRWNRTGLLNARSLVQRWCREELAGFPPPSLAMLRSGAVFASGDNLQVETEASRLELPRMAAELLRLLRSRGSVREVAVEAVPGAERAAADPAGDAGAVFELAGEFPGPGPGPGRASDAEPEAPAVPPAVPNRRLRDADLAWLLPGEWLVSPHRGSYRLKRSDVDAGSFLLRNERGDFLSLDAAELRAEFRRRDP